MILWALLWLLLKGPGDAAPVEVKNPDPIPVDVMRHTEAATTTDARAIAAANAVDAEGLATGGQRRINLMWERTQAIIAISVVEATLLVVTILVLSPVLAMFSGATVNQAIATAAVTGLVLLSNLVGNVTGFYFSRTNHTKTGGVAGADSLARPRGE